MKKETLINLLKSHSAKLQGKFSAYDKTKDKQLFIIEAKQIINEMLEMIQDLEKCDKND